MRSHRAEADPNDREPLRLSKVVAALVPCSRREAEQYITEGHVRVDGRRVDQPQERVGPSQRVEIEPGARLQPPQPATLLLHKPAGMKPDDARALLGAQSHWADDASGLRFGKQHLAGLLPLLELPAAASGLVVFSQARSIVRKLTEDAVLIEQELIAEVAGTMVPDGLERLAAAVPGARVSWQSESRLRFAVKGVVLDRIETICAEVGLQLIALRRIRIGRVPMARLPVGQWRYLAAGERF